MSDLIERLNQRKALFNSMPDRDCEEAAAALEAAQREIEAARVSLQFVLSRGDVGVFSAGSNLHGVEGHTWHCHGCDGWAATKGYAYDEKPRDKNFPHKPDCRYMAARAIAYRLNEQAAREPTD